MAPTKTRQAYSEDDLQRAVNAVKEDGKDEEDVLRVWCIELCRRGFPVTDDDLMD